MLRRAVCVGVYRQDDDSLKPISHCGADLDAMGSMLSSSECGFDVRRLDNPSSKDFLERLWEALEDLGREDELLVYFSGHGRRSKARQLQLCTCNTEATKLIPTSVGFDNLLAAIKECEVGAILVVLDCCFSGAAAETIFKGDGEDVMDLHEDTINASKGLAVLCSSSAVETSLAMKTDSRSLFTDALLQVCNERIKGASGWVSVSEVYEDLRKALFAHTPRLLGDNPTFRMLCGAQGAVHEEQLEIRLEPVPSGQPTFCGMLVGEGFRAWLVAMLDATLPAEAEKVAKNVHALFNPVELYAGKIEGAQDALRRAKKPLAGLAKTIGAPLLLLHPISLEQIMFRRMRGVDRNYILTCSRPLASERFPPVLSKGMHLIMFEDSGTSDSIVLHAPEDYLRDNFGINQEETWVPEIGMVVRLSQDTFRRNAKHLAIEAKTSRLEGALTVGKETEPAKLVFERSVESESVQLARKVAKSKPAIKEPPKPEGAEDRLFGKLIERVATDRSISPMKIREPRESTGKKQADPNCKVCNGVGFRNVEWDLRTYRVPCKRCNRDYNQTWRLFADR